MIIGKDGTLAAPRCVCQDFTVRIIWRGCHQRVDGGYRVHRSRPLTFPAIGEDTAVLKILLFLGDYTSLHMNEGSLVILSHPSLLGPFECRTFICPTLDLK